MALPLQPEFWSENKGEPKRKFKFYVEFGNGSLIDTLYPNHSYQWMIKSVTKPKPTLEVKEASDAETRTWFGSIPDPSKRSLGTVSWSPISIKFVNQLTRRENTNYSLKSFEYQPPDIEHPPVIPAAVDLDHLFSRLVEEADSAFAGGIAGKELDWNKLVISSKEDAIARYRDTIKADAAKLKDFTQKSFSDQARIAQTDASMGASGMALNSELLYSINKSSDANTLSSLNCKSSIDQFLKASCLFIKYFGEIRIYDMVTNSPHVKNPSSSKDLAAPSATLSNGYWTLRNAWVKSVDFGNGDYSSDDFQEYTLEIGYESARYVASDV